MVIKTPPIGQKPGPKTVPEPVTGLISQVPGRPKRTSLSSRVWVSIAHIIIPFFAVAVLWDLARLVGILPQQFIPEFWAIVSELFTQLFEGPSGDLLEATGQTLTTWALGFLLASAIGITFGVLIGVSPIWSAALTPLLRFARAIPTVAFIPAAILVAGVGLEAKLMIVTYAGIWPVLVNTASGVRYVPNLYRDNGKVNGLTNGRIIRSVVIPAMSPAIFTGLRTAMALTLAVTIGADLLIGSSGIGSYINWEQTLGQTTSAYAGVLWGGLLGTLLMVVLVFIEARLLFWSPEFRAKGGRK